MFKYEIDYQYGFANFWTPTEDEKTALKEFGRCASNCFGIRKSLGEITLQMRHADAELPLPYRGLDGTHLLTHNGDEILFDARYVDSSGDWLKLRHEGGDYCSCKERGKPEEPCEIHKYSALGKEFENTYTLIEPLVLPSNARELLEPFFEAYSKWKGITDYAQRILDGQEGYLVWPVYRRQITELLEGQPFGGNLLEGD
jgi:hypothetical protein